MAGTRGQLVDQWRPEQRNLATFRRISPHSKDRRGFTTDDQHPRVRTNSSYRTPPRRSSRRRTRSPSIGRDDTFHRNPRSPRPSPSPDRHHAPLSHRHDSRPPSQQRFGRYRPRSSSSSSARSAHHRKDIDRAYGSRNPSVDRYRGHNVSGHRSSDLVDSYIPPARSREPLSTSAYRSRADQRRSPSPLRPSSRKRQRSRSPDASRNKFRPRVSRSRSREISSLANPLRDRLSRDDLFSESRRRRSPSLSRRARQASRVRSPPSPEEKMRPSYSYPSRGGPPRTSRGGYDAHHSSPPHPAYPPPPATSHGPSPYWSHPPHNQAGSPPPPFPPPPHSPFGHAPGYFPPPPVPPPVPYGVSPPPIPPPYPSTSAPRGSSPYPARDTFRGGHDRPYDRERERERERERPGYGSSYPPSDRRTSGGSSAPYRPSERPPARARGTFSNLSWTPATGSRGGKIEYKGRDGVKSEDSGTDAQSPVETSTDMPVPGPAPNAPPDTRIKFEFKSKAPPPPTLSKEFPPPARASLPRPPPPTRYDAREDYPPRDYRDDYREEYREEYRDDYHDDYRDSYRDGYRDDYRDRRGYRDDYRERDSRHYGRRYDDRYAERYDERTARYYERPPRDVREPIRHDKYREPRPEPKLVKRMKQRPTLSKEFAESDSVYFRKPGNESVVGSGTYGKVFKAIHVYTGNKVALKKIRMEGERDGFPITAIREVKLLQSLNHANIVRLQEVMVERNDCYMVFEYLSHDLTGLLNHPSFKLENYHKKDLAKQLFTGLDYLHRRGVLHRDIKAANILVSNTGQLKLADFGLARFFAKRRQLDYTNRVITIWYRSPELLLGETQYGPAVDIWSAACVLCEIFTKHAIFPGDGGEINQLDRIYAVLGTPTRTEWPAIVDTPWFELLRPAERKTCTFAEKYADVVPSPAAFELLKSMFAYDPTKRPDAAAVLQHAYFTQEEPQPRQATELEALSGDWHEFESKALRKERERVDREARRAQKDREPAAAGTGLEAEGAKLDRKRSVRDMVSAAAASGDSAGAVDVAERDAKRQRVEDMGVAVPPPPPPAKGDEAAAEEHDQGDGMGSAPMSMRGT